MLVCRTCLSKDDLTPLFGELSSHRFSSEDLFSSTGVQIAPSDGLPQTACSSCINLIKNALDLRLLSSKSDELLKSIPKSTFEIKTERDYFEDLENIFDSEIIGFDKTFFQDDWNKTCTLSKMAKNSKEDMLNMECVKKEPFVNQESKATENDSSNEPNYTEIEETLPNETSLPTNQSNSKLLDDFESDSDQSINIKFEDFESDNEKDLRMPTKMKSFKFEHFNYKNCDDSNKSQKFYEIGLRNKPGKKLKKIKKKLIVPKTPQNKYMALAVPLESSEALQCKICNHIAKNKYNFQCHARLHFEPGFTCQDCDKKFYTGSHLRYHQQRMHGKEKRLKCSECDYRCVDRLTLKNHERLMHSGERPYVCDECNTSFRMRNNLIQHIRHRHYAVKNVICEMCPQMFKSRSELWTHQHKVHIMNYTYHCYLCPETYKGLLAVKRHLVNVHGVPRDEQLKIKCVKTRKNQNN